MSEVSFSEIIKNINIAREYPKYFIPLIDEQLSLFVNQKDYRLKGQETLCETNEGKQAWINAKKFLQQQPPISPLTQHKGLTKAAQQQANNLEKFNQMTHRGSEGETFVERITKYCHRGKGALAEIIGSNFIVSNQNHAQMIVLGLIIDDGIESKGHRKSIFNKDFKYVGCGVGCLSDKVVGVLNLSEINLQERIVQRSVASSRLSSKRSTNQSQIFQSLESSQDSKVSESESVKGAGESLKIKRNSQFSASSVSSKIPLPKSSRGGSRIEENICPTPAWTFHKVESEQLEKNSSQQQFEQQHSVQSCVKSEKPRTKKSKLSEKENSRISESPVSEVPTLKSYSHQARSPEQRREESNSQNSYSRLGSPLSKNSKAASEQPLKTPGPGSKSKHKFTASDLSNHYMSQVSGFKKVKQKKEISKMWEQGEFKFEEKLTSVIYTDGTQESVKEKTSVLIEN